MRNGDVKSYIIGLWLIMYMDSAHDGAEDGGPMKYKARLADDILRNAAMKAKIWQTNTAPKFPNGYRNDSEMHSSNDLLIGRKERTEIF